MPAPHTPANLADDDAADDALPWEEIMALAQCARDREGLLRLQHPLAADAVITDRIESALDKLRRRYHRQHADWQHAD